VKMLSIRHLTDFKKYLWVLLILLGSHTVLAQDKTKGPPPSPVKVAEVKKGTVSDTISLIGTAEPLRTSKVATEVLGIVKAFPVKKGDFIQKGDLIVELRSRALDLKLKETLAEKETISANLALAEKELKRTSKLRESKSISEKLFDAAFYEHMAFSKNLAAKEAAIEIIRYELDQKRVRAPFSGFIAEEHIQIGEWLKEGGSVVTLMDLSEIFITVDVPERYAIYLSPKASVTAYFPSLSKEPVEARIDAILPQGDAMARTIPIRIKMKNAGFKVKAGMEVHVTFRLPGLKDVLLVPKDAVVSAGQNRMVWIAAQGSVRMVPVSILDYFDSDAAIEGAIKPGEMVVVRGNERLRPGQPVQVLEP
jgi:RND family efflux transporter MFP subunit